jgi:hypothetical protein
MNEFINLDTQNGRNADCVDMIKTTVYTLCVTVLSRLVKYTGSWGSMILKPEDLDKLRVGSLTQGLAWSFDVINQRGDTMKQ